MNQHRYAYWGIGHMSHPEDPTGCCSRPEADPIHRCGRSVRSGLQAEWTCCAQPFEHEGACQIGGTTERQIVDECGIDHPAASFCSFCELRHFSGTACPPVLPAGTETWGGVA